MRVIIAGGGTGGHVIPALAIARELRDRYKAYVIFIGTPRGMENRLVPAAGFELKLVQVGALKNVTLATRARTLVDLPLAVLTAFNLIHEFRPNVVIGVGGYASGPGMLAAVLRRVPTMAFEPNVVPGFANRVVSRFVSAAAVHFAETTRYFRNAEVTGVPVRADFFQVPPRPADARPTLLIFGGSQGSLPLNNAVVAALPELYRRVPGLHVIHQTGERAFNDVQQAYLACGGSAEVSRFIDDMPQTFARADLLLCRSGASTVAEVAAAGKPAIFVPFPQAADDHQTRNAEPFARAGAGVLLPQSQLTTEKLVEKVASLLADRARLAEMGERARQLAHADATQRITRMAARLAGFDADGAGA